MLVQVADLLLDSLLLNEENVVVLLEIGWVAPLFHLPKTVLLLPLDLELGGEGVHGGLEGFKLCHHLHHTGFLVSLLSPLLSQQPLGCLESSIV